ncbi:MAG: RsmB/NOP family class I SAM-dependent RNA methyltransferase [Bacillota bacterium]|nr:RsmB/NOP family class I SAM-dependent RNA methyltransferase [Bacillota bacterium]
MKLPQEFLNKMKNLLGEEEYENFLESYSSARYYGLRVNTLKTGTKEFLDISPFDLQPVPWTRDGFYYPEGESPGRHPYYHAGLYYIQEPSAMLPGEVLGAKPGENVLDICAAPGGKTVQIAAGMKGKGLLVSNDINSDRVKALVKNIELCGVRNAIVTNESPEKLSRNFNGFFDRILVDAPCSGEGMFRKDEDAARSWENFKCERCSSMQQEILSYVDKMLKPGGILVYSTCTFAPEEDEKMIASFINQNGHYNIAKIPRIAGIDRGRPEWADGNIGLEGTVRLWPHKLKGEGHFVAMLYKEGTEGCQAVDKYSQMQWAEGIPPQYKEVFNRFVGDNLNTEIKGYLYIKGNNLYCLPVEMPDLNGLKVAKFGWYLGEFNNGRFEPSHSLITSLDKNDIKRTVDFNSGSREVLAYLKGETLIIEGEKGYTGICVDGYTLGWAKQTGDMLKNLYPKGWRKMS